MVGVRAPEACKVVFEPASNDGDGAWIDGGMCARAIADAPDDGVGAEESESKGFLRSALGVWSPLGPHNFNMLLSTLLLIPCSSLWSVSST